MKKFLLPLAGVLVFVSCSKVTESDLTRACTKIGNTPKYLASSVFADEYYKLQDKAGDNDLAGALVLEYTLKTIELKAIGGLAFEEACKSVLREDFMGVEPEPEPNNSTPVYEKKDQNALKQEKESRDTKRAEIISSAKLTNLYCPRIRPGKYEGSYDRHWIAAQLYKVEDKLEHANVYGFTPKEEAEGYCELSNDYKAGMCSSVYIEKDPTEFKYNALSEICDLGVLPLCEKVGSSLVWVEAASPRYDWYIKTSDNYYEIEVSTYVGGMHLNRKNLEAQWGSYFPDGKPNEDDAFYQCEAVSDEEFSEKVTKPIKTRLNDAVNEIQNQNSPKETESEIEEVQEQPLI